MLPPVPTPQIYLENPPAEKNGHSSRESQNLVVEETNDLNDTIALNLTETTFLLNETILNDQMNDQNKKTQNSSNITVRTIK